MKALILDAEKKTAFVGSKTRPIPQPSEILVKVNAIALNPIDPLYTYHPLGTTGRTLGSDFAGTVASLGDSVPASSGLSPGDRVAGFLQGACSVDEKPGAFAEYLIVPWDLVWRLPKNMGLEEAAAVSLCGLTAAQAINYRFGLTAPFTWGGNAPEQENNNSETLNFFIYGASTSVALYAAQIVHHTAKASRRKIRLLGTASKGRFEMLKASPYSYDHLVDYHDADWPEQIRKLCGDEGVHFAYDCISEGDSVERVCQSLGKEGKVAIVRSRKTGAWQAGELPTEPIYGAVWEGLGVEIQYHGFVIPEDPGARAFAVEFYKWLSEGGKLQPNPVRLMPGGLERVVEDGFVLLGPDMMEDRGKGRTEAWMKPVSAEKLVYKIVE